MLVAYLVVGIASFFGDSSNSSIQKSVFVTKNLGKGFSLFVVAENEKEGEENKCHLFLISDASNNTFLGVDLKTQSQQAAILVDAVSTTKIYLRYRSLLI